MNLEVMFLEAEKKIDEKITALYIEGMCNKSEDDSKILNFNVLELYLKKRGYITNNILNKIIFTKDFTCVAFENNIIEIWHDINNSKVITFNNSFLTNLPLYLNYMEKI